MYHCKRAKDHILNMKIPLQILWNFLHENELVADVLWILACILWIEQPAVRYLCIALSFCIMFLFCCLLFFLLLGGAKHCVCSFGFEVSKCSQNLLSLSLSLSSQIWWVIIMYGHFFNELHDCCCTHSGEHNQYSSIDTGAPCCVWLFEFIKDCCYA